MNYRQRLGLAGRIIETNTYLLHYLIQYAESHGIPLPIDGEQFKVLEAQANQEIRQLERPSPDAGHPKKYPEYGTEP